MSIDVNLFIASVIRKVLTMMALTPKFPRDPKITNFMKIFVSISGFHFASNIPNSIGFGLHFNLVKKI